MFQRREERRRSLGVLVLPLRSEALRAALCLHAFGRVLATWASPVNGTPRGDAELQMLMLTSSLVILMLTLLSHLHNRSEVFHRKENASPLRGPSVSFLT